jgi:hypothetical protein
MSGEKVTVQRQVVSLQITSPVQPGSFAPDSWDWHSLLDLGGGPASTVSVIDFGSVEILEVDPDEDYPDEVPPATTPRAGDGRDS